MTGSKYLLDTCIVVEIFKGNKNIIEKVNKLSDFSISAIVLGELFIGTNRVINKSKHLKKLTDFISITKVFPLDSDTAEHYGLIVAELYKKGKPIPSNDIWIASTALQHGLTLITADNHFTEISQLKIKFW
ncbi:MAG: type II toxin-antitoxin system VapC family toxin [Bacteroidota bacterium]